MGVELLNKTTNIASLFETLRSIWRTPYPNVSHLSRSLGGDVQPMVYHLLMSRLLAPEWLDWEPETVWTTLEKVYGLTFDDYEKTKIHAVRACHSSRFLTDWEAFEKVALAFDGVIPEFNIVQACSPLQVMHAMGYAMLMRLEKEPVFSREVMMYCAIMFVQREFLVVPNFMKRLNRFIVETTGRDDIVKDVLFNPIIGNVENERNIQAARFVGLDNLAQEFILDQEKIIDNFYNVIR